MKELISQVFTIEKKLTPEDFASLKEFNIIDAGGVPEESYEYHLHIDTIGEELKANLEKRFGLRFVETREYKIEEKFPRYQ